MQALSNILRDLKICKPNRIGGAESGGQEGSDLIRSDEDELGGQEGSQLLQSNRRRMDWMALDEATWMENLNVMWRRIVEREF